MQCVQQPPLATDAAAANHRCTRDAAKRHHDEMAAPLQGVRIGVISQSACSFELRALRSNHT